MDLKSLIPSFGRKSVPVRREEENPIMSLHREMNRLFDGFLQGWESGDGRMSAFAPRIDMTEDDKSLRVTAELPGMTDKDIEVSISREMLTIRGEKKDEKEERKDNYFYSERSYGSFSRTIGLPREIDADKASADFKKGVLTITLPKTAAAAKSTKKIPVAAD